MTSFDEVVIMLHKFDSNSEHTFFTLQMIFGFLLKIVSCDKRLILKEHHTIMFAWICLKFRREKHEKHAFGEEILVVDIYTEMTLKMCLSTVPL